MVLPFPVGPSTTSPSNTPRSWPGRWAAPTQRRPTSWTAWDARTSGSWWTRTSSQPATTLPLAQWWMEMWCPMIPKSSCSRWCSGASIRVGTPEMSYTWFLRMLSGLSCGEKSQTRTCCSSCERDLSIYLAVTFSSCSGCEHTVSAMCLNGIFSPMNSVLQSSFVTGLWAVCLKCHWDEEVSLFYIHSVYRKHRKDEKIIRKSLFYFIWWPLGLCSITQVCPDWK